MRFNQIFSSRFAIAHFQVTNHCNLHCENCGAMSHLGIRKDSPCIWMRRLWEMEPSTAMLFCERFHGVGEADWHNLTGGEPTAMKLSHLEALIDVFHHYGRALTIRTNAYGLRCLPEEYVQKFARIWLDDHDINAGVVQETLIWLRTFYKGVARHQHIPSHHDWVAAWNAGKVHRTQPCGQWFRYLLVNPRGIVYPCCGMPGIVAIANEERIEAELRKAGWCLENRNLVETLKNWRKTVPSYIMETCLQRCYYPEYKRFPAARITLKENDVLRRECK